MFNAASAVPFTPPEVVYSKKQQSPASKRIDLGTYGRLEDLLAVPPQGVRVEPVYVVADQGYTYARQFSLRLMGCPVRWQ